MDYGNHLQNGTNDQTLSIVYRRCLRLYAGGLMK
jgi:hypothetical protein